MNVDLPRAERATPANRLESATSPYLQQHAHNPVDWYEWGPEAIDKARRENRPIFLSIGYSACHWCHVMAHESFENEEIAEVLNRHFVNIKVDREERPDLDEIYMQATMMLNQGQGGWPMSVWLTPDLKPFFAGTYYPPTSRWGRPGFRELCLRIGELWETRREALLSDADRLTEYLQRSLRAASQDGAAFSLEAIDRTVDLLAGAFDTTHGGILSGGTNKFPPSMALELMLRSAVRRAGEQPRARRLLELVELTLDKIANGGIYDHLAGGIARYSTDATWLVPHFEKMLYDQALVSRIYVDAFQHTGKPLYARVARETFDYVLADLQSPQGGFYSTRDADSEGVEGKYYVWTREEIGDALGEGETELFCSYYGVTETGNWEDPHHPGEPKNILHVQRSPETVAALHQISPTDLEARLAASRKTLLEIRAKRRPPHRDEKILCEWNGMMIASLARGGSVLCEPRYVQAAARSAEFLLENQYRDGRLRRSFRDGRVLETAFLSDYACLIEGLLELHDATLETRWLTRAMELNQTAIELFYDDSQGGFFFTPSDHEQLITRTKDVRDSATPSGNSVQLMNVLRLATLTGEKRLCEIAEKTMQYFAAEVIGSPGSGERFLAAAEFSLAGPVEIALIGRPSDPRTQSLIRCVHAEYLPNRVMLLRDPDSADGVTSPLLSGRSMLEDCPTAYVCRNYACRRPVCTPQELVEQLLQR